VISGIVHVLKSGGRWIDAPPGSVGMAPVVLGKRMSNNKGAMLHPPNACGGGCIREGWIPDDLLPVMVVYNEVDTLAFGTANVSEDVNTSPLSVARFEKAAIIAATHQEFDTWRKGPQVANLESGCR
jgi:hypothetical protein